MTDEERVLEIAVDIFARERAAFTASGSGYNNTFGAREAFEAADAVLKEWRSRTAPREQPAQDVSTDLLERCANVAEWSAYSALARELREIISARALREVLGPRPDYRTVDTAKAERVTL